MNKLNGIVARSGIQGLNECLKNIGKEFGVKAGVRPIAGNKGGCTGGGSAASGSPKMTRIGGGKGLGAAAGGKGPTITLAKQETSFKESGKEFGTKAGLRPVGGNKGGVTG